MHTGRVPQEPGRPRSFLCSIPGRSPGDQGPGHAQVRAAPARGANEAAQHGYDRPSLPRAIGRRASSRSPQYYVTTEVMRGRVIRHKCWWRDIMAKRYVVELTEEERAQLQAVG